MKVNITYLRREGENLIWTPIILGAVLHYEKKLKELFVVWREARPHLNIIFKPKFNVSVDVDTEGLPTDEVLSTIDETIRKLFPSPDFDVEFPTFSLVPSRRGRKVVVWWKILPDTNQTVSLPSPEKIVKEISKTMEEKFGKIYPFATEFEDGVEWVKNDLVTFSNVVLKFPRVDPHAVSVVLSLIGVGKFYPVTDIIKGLTDGDLTITKFSETEEFIHIEMKRPTETGEVS